MDVLQEIYEVDAAKEPEGSKDRHDHVVTRGLARRRREAIAALPSRPFQFIVNFQIPGDPPVSRFNSPDLLPATASVSMCVRSA